MTPELGRVLINRGAATRSHIDVWLNWKDMIPLAAGGVGVLDLDAIRHWQRGMTRPAMFTR